MLIVYKLYTIDCHYENTEHMQDIANPNTAINNEAVCNIASLYNNGKFTATDSNITGNMSVVGDLSAGSFNLLPKGMIIAWYPQAATNSQDPISSVGLKPPAGWLICDGTNNTPDLRGRFIRMYSDDLSGAAVIKDDNNNDIKYRASVNISESIKFKKRVGNSIINPKTSILPFQIGEFAGTDLIGLDKSEMPTHNHTIHIWGDAGGELKSGDSKGIKLTDRMNHFLDSSNPSNVKCRSSNDGCARVGGNANSVSILNNGGSQSHNNVPPFFTLVYLMKA